MCAGVDKLLSVDLHGFHKVYRGIIDPDDKREVYQPSSCKGCERGRMDVSDYATTGANIKISYMTLQYVHGLLHSRKYLWVSTALDSRKYPLLLTAKGEVR